MTKKTISKIGDKLTMVNESFSINMYDNGFMFEIGGRDTNGDWKTAKVMCTTLDQVLELVKEASEMKRDE